jgi:hypothetical protein
MGRAEGVGDGEGRGEHTATNVAIGSGVAVACSVLICLFGVPMFFAGIAFVALGIL